MKTMISKLAVGLSLIGSLLILWGCGSAKEPLSAEEWSKMENVIGSQNFVFVARLAEPIGSRVNQIDLTGNVNYMSMQADAVKMELPYFGTRQVAQPGAINQGIRFEGTAVDIRKTKNEKQNYYDLDFKIRDKSESFNCNLRMYSAMRAVLTVNSSQRNSIRYEGELRPID